MKILALLLLTVAVAANPLSIGRSASGAWATAIEVLNSEPVHFVTCGHCPAGTTFTFPSGEITTVAGSKKIRGGPMRLPDGSFGGEADVRIGWFTGPLTSPTVEVWWDWPAGLKEGQTIPILFHSQSGEQAGTGSWFVGPTEYATGCRFTGTVLPGDSGAPVFSEGKLLGPISGQAPGGGNTSTICWTFEEWPERYPWWQTPYLTEQGGNILVSWQLPLYRLQTRVSLFDEWQDTQETSFPKLTRQYFRLVRE